jgi:hypothetical protein
LNGCSLYTNSSATTAISMGGSSRLSALAVGAVGGVAGEANITATNGIRMGIGALTDPYASVSYPAFYGCTEQNFTAKDSITIDPGVYCGGIGVNAGAVLTLSAGIYYLDGGSLTVNGGGTIQGDGVTLVFTKKNKNTWADATINGNGTINLTAPKTGTTAGIVLFGDRNMPVGTAFKFNGGASQYFGGAIYLPSAAIDFAGGASTGMNCTQLIGDTIAFSGNSALSLNCSSAGTKPFSPLTIRLTS